MSILLWLSAKAYWLLWPALFLILRDSRRTRVLLICGQSALMVKSWFGDGRWSLPGGGVHDGEADDVSAVREVREEVGITLDPKTLKSLGRATYTKRAITTTHIRFVAHVASNLAITRQWYEITHAQWLPMDSLNAANTDQAALDHIAAWRAVS